MATPQSQIGHALREAREAAGLTQRQAADLLGVDAQTISRWERGERGIKAHLYESILAKLRSQIGLDHHVPRGTVTSDGDETGSATERLYALGQALARAGADRAEIDAALDAMERVGKRHPSSFLPHDEEQLLPPEPEGRKATRRGRPA